MLQVKKEEQKQSLCALADRCQENCKETKVIKLNILCQLDKYFITDKGLLLRVHMNFELPSDGLTACGITNTQWHHKTLSGITNTQHLSSLDKPFVQGKDNCIVICLSRYDIHMPQ